MKLTKVTKALGTLVLLAVMGILPVASLTLQATSNGTTIMANTHDGGDPMPPFPHGGHPGLA